MGFEKLGGVPDPGEAALDYDNGAVRAAGDGVFHGARGAARHTIGDESHVHTGESGRVDGALHGIGAVADADHGALDALAGEEAELIFEEGPVEKRPERAVQPRRNRATPEVESPYQYYRSRRVHYLFLSRSSSSLKKALILATIGSGDICRGFGDKRPKLAYPCRYLSLGLGHEDAAHLAVLARGAHLVVVYVLAEARAARHYEKRLTRLGRADDSTRPGVADKRRGSAHVSAVRLLVEIFGPLHVPGPIAAPADLGKDIIAQHALPRGLVDRADEPVERKYRTHRYEYHTNCPWYSEPLYPETSSGHCTIKTSAKYRTMRPERDGRSTLAMLSTHTTFAPDELSEGAHETAMSGAGAYDYVGPLAKHYTHALEERLRHPQRVAVVRFGDDIHFRAVGRGQVVSGEVARGHEEPLAPLPDSFESEELV